MSRGKEWRDIIILEHSDQIIIIGVQMCKRPNIENLEPDPDYWKQIIHLFFLIWAAINV